MITQDIYENYFQALLQGDRTACSRLVQQLLDQDISLYELYVDLFQRSLYEIGYLWETNKISVSVEHMATSVTESLLTMVYPKIFSADHKGKKAVVSCLVNEYHQIGGKMVADFFELYGWDGYFLGANVPVASLMQVISAKQPDMLALSLSIYSNLNYLHQVLEQVCSEHPDLDIIVGGQAFRWGGRDIQDKFASVRYIASIKDLENILESHD